MTLRVKHSNLDQNLCTFPKARESSSTISKICKIVLVIFALLAITSFSHTLLSNSPVSTQANLPSPIPKPEDPFIESITQALESVHGDTNCMMAMALKERTDPNVYHDYKFLTSFERFSGEITTKLDGEEHYMFINPSDMGHSIMQGNFKKSFFNGEIAYDGRLFIAMKVRNVAGEVFTQVFHTQYPADPRMIVKNPWITYEGPVVKKTGKLNMEDFVLIAKLYHYGRAGGLSLVKR